MKVLRVWNDSRASFKRLASTTFAPDKLLLIVSLLAFHHCFTVFVLFCLNVFLIQPSGRDNKSTREKVLILACALQICIDLSFALLFVFSYSDSCF